MSATYTYEKIGAYVRYSAALVRHYASPKWLARKLLRPATIGCAYAAVALYTFGHVAATNYRADQHEYTACDRARAARDPDAYDRCEQPNSPIDAMLGAAAGAFWPLYLAWELQQ